MPNPTPVPHLAMSGRGGILHSHEEVLLVLRQLVLDLTEPALRVSEHLKGGGGGGRGGRDAQTGPAMGK